MRFSACRLVSGLARAGSAECVARALPGRVTFLRADDYLADHLQDLRTWDIAPVHGP